MPFHIYVRAQEVLAAAGTPQLPERPLYQPLSERWQGQDLVYTYERAITEMLRADTGPLLLFEGGLAWRLAVQYGPPDIVQRALAGPAAVVTRTSPNCYKFLILPS